MYTTETSAGSDSIAAQRQVSPHTNRYLVPGLSFEGGILKEQHKRHFLCASSCPIQRGCSMDSNKRCFLLKSITDQA